MSSPGELPTVDAASLKSKPVSQRQWHVGEFIPSRVVTMLSGDAGTGKSQIALQLAVTTVAGGYWLGREAEPGAVIYLSAEDELDELHRRLVDIAADQNIDMADMAGLTFVPLAGQDAVLAIAGKNGILQPTSRYAEVGALVAARKPRLVVLDTLADVFAGDENNRAHARQFIGLLRRLCLAHDTTVLLLAHPSLSGMASGTGMSGSTAWNASVRSRLYFERIKNGDNTEDDPDARVLKSLKANYARAGAAIKVRWQSGVFKPAGTTDSFTIMSQQSKAERTFLELLRAYDDEGRPVSASTGHGYAPALFARDGRADGVTKPGFIAAMNRLFETGRIRNVEIGPPSRRTRKIEIAPQARE